MRKIHVILILSSLRIFISCCGDPCYAIDYPSGNWVKRSELNRGRSEAVGFTLGDFAYIGTGLDSTAKCLEDFWKYDPAADGWEQVASLPQGAERSSAVGFAIDMVGFCGTGNNGSVYLNDFYKYFPVSNTWRKMNAVFPGKARSEAVGFSIRDSGYVGTGFDGSQALADFYRYDPASDEWTAIPFSGQARYSAAVFVYNNKAYLVTGTNGDTLLSEFLVFNPQQSSLSWNSLHSITNSSPESFDDSYSTITRVNSAAFIIGDHGYISTGLRNDGLTSTTWEYSFATDLWDEKTPFEGPLTTGAVGITINNRGYLASGKNTPPGYNFIWEFQPNADMNPNDN